MKIFIIIALLFSLLSCDTKKNLPAGSTKENIEKSPHAVVQFTVDNQLCMATINQSFKNFNRKSEFPFSLWIKVETLNKDENGFPANDEATAFNKLEDSVIDALDGKTPYCFIGRTTRNGYREIMIYVHDKEETNRLISEFVRKNSSSREIEFDISPDDTWESVGGLLD